MQFVTSRGVDLLWDPPYNILTVVRDSSSGADRHTVDIPSNGWPEKFRGQWLQSTRPGAPEVISCTEEV